MGSGVGEGAWGEREDFTSPNVRWEQEALENNDVSVFSLDDSVGHS